MSEPVSVAVCSRSFSRHPVLRAETLQRWPDARFNDAGATLSGDELAEFLDGAERAITAMETVDEALLARLPGLRRISKVGVGLDMIDQDAMARHGVELGWTPGTNRRSVAELVVAFAIVLLRHVPALRDDLRAGTWRQPKGRQLGGTTVGIVGFGHVGRDVALLLRAFGCRLLVHDLVALAVEELGDARQVELDELLAASDVVTLHVALTEQTRGLLDRRRVALMPEGAVLINTARGGLVDEAALREALQSGALAGAALDVFASEPPDDPELLALPNLLATPHIGGSTEEAIIAMGRAAIAALDDEGTT